MTLSKSLDKRSNQMYLYRGGVTEQTSWIEREILSWVKLLSI